MEDDPTSDFQDQLDSISQRLAKIEQRLGTLERSLKPVSKAKDLRRKIKPTPKQNPHLLKHNYLRKTIAEARRRYRSEQR